MKPSILIDTTVGGAPWTAVFTIEEPPRTLFQAGLAGAETAVIQFLTRDVEPSEAADADWADYQADGAVVALSTHDNLRALYARGVYRVRVAAAAATARIGVY